MRQQFDSKIWANRSQQTTGNVTIVFSEHDHQRSQRQKRCMPVAVQRVHVESRTPQRYYDEFIVVDKEKEATTGRWVLNVIAAHEAYQQALKKNKNHVQSNKKKHSFTLSKSSKVQPIENLSSRFIGTPFYQTQIKSQNLNQYPHHTMISPTSIGDGLTTPMSNFSSATSIDHIRTASRSSLSSPSRFNWDDCSTDQFKNRENQLCIPKPIIIACTILAAFLIIGIIVAVFIIIFVGRNQTSSASGKSLDPKSLLAPFSTIDDTICSTEMFNLTDPLCSGQIPYTYYSCYQMVTSTSLTIRFAFQHDTMSGHWYFDDINAVQNANLPLIINGGFETNLTGWIVNISSNSTSETYIHTMTGLAHTGLAYLYGVSKNSPGYIEQTFNVTVDEYIHISFWWGYDGGMNIGNTCQAIGQLIPSF